MHLQGLRNIIHFKERYRSAYAKICIIGTHSSSKNSWTFEIYIFIDTKKQKLFAGKILLKEM